MRKWLIGMMVLSGGLMTIGCSPELETGYKPRPLSASEAERRAYYAERFSPEAQPGTQIRLGLPVRQGG
jgi:hypothetical protein